MIECDHERPTRRKAEAGTQSKSPIASEETKTGALARTPVRNASSSHIKGPALVRQT